MLHSPLTSYAVYGNYNPMDLINEASQNIADRLTWHTANRDQAGIAKNLADGQDIPEVYGLGEAGLFDEFFYFLDHLGFKDLFMGLDPKSKKRESNVPFMAIIFIYLMRIVAGLLWDSTVDRLEKAHVIGERKKLPAILMRKVNNQPKYEALRVLISLLLP